MRPPDPSTLHGLIERLPRFGRRQALGIREDLGLRWWTYQRVYDAAHAAAAHLEEAGIRKGDRVVLQERNAPEWVAFFFGAALRGAVLVPLDHDASAESLSRTVAAVGASAYVSPHEASAADAKRLDLSFLYAAAAARQHTAVEIEPGDPAVLFFTSGTTADPRGVILTHANLAAQVARFRGWRWMARPIAWRMLVMAPLSHAQGLVVGAVVPLSVGLSVIYTHASDANHLLRVLRDNRVPLFSTLPRVLHVLRKALLGQLYGIGPETLGDKLARSRRWMLRRHFVFTHLRRVVTYKGLWVVIVGGAGLPEEDEEFWRVSGSLLVQGYGLTETAAIVSVNSPILGRFGSVGKPAAETEVRIADDGEILVRGASVAASYFGSAALKVEEDGFLRTGDLGRFDDRRRLYVVGRKKEVIVTGEGFNVHGANVEAALRRQPGVVDALVVPRDRDGHAEVHAVLILTSAGDAPAIVKAANGGLLPHEQIRGWTIWPDPDFPRSPLMKPRRQVIADAVARGIGGGDNVDATAATLADIVAIPDRQARVQALATYITSAPVGADEVARTSLVNEAGLGSLDLVELLARLEQRSGRSLDRLAIDRDVTVADLQALVKNPDQKRLRRFYARDAPRWAELSVMTPIRQLLNPLVLGTCVRLRTRFSSTGAEHLAGLPLPAIFAAGGHEHGFDVLLIYHALPPRIRRRLAIVMHRWVLTDALEPRPESRRRDRLLVGLGFHAIVPVFFPVALSAQYTRSRDALIDVCRLLDRGYSVIGFGGAGLAAAARQCGVPIVPVRVDNRDRADFRLGARRVDAAIHFEPPIHPTPADLDAELAARLAEFYRRAEEVRGYD